MDIERFITNRSYVWSELDTLLDAADIRELAHDEVHHLVELYRRCVVFVFPVPCGDS